MGYSTGRRQKSLRSCHGFKKNKYHGFIYTRIDNPENILDTFWIFQTNSKLLFESENGITFIVDSNSRNSQPTLNWFKKSRTFIKYSRDCLFSYRWWNNPYIGTMRPMTRSNDLPDDRCWLEMVSKALLVVGTGCSSRFILFACSSVWVIPTSSAKNSCAQSWLSWSA